MALTEYQKALSAFIGLTYPVPDTDSLHTEVAAKLTILTGLNRIDVVGTTYSFWFKDPLSAGEQTALTQVVEAHTGEPATEAVSVTIDRDSDITERGTHDYDRDNLGVFKAPRGTVFPTPEVADELFIRIDEKKIYQRNSANTAWEEMGGGAATGAIVENGFEDASDTTISFTDGTRTFEIAPAVTSFTFWSGTVQYTKSSAQQIVIPDTEGLHIIYFDGSGNLQSTQIFLPTIITTFAICAIVYWDATNDESIIFHDERHGRRMDGETHLYLHGILGAQVFGVTGIGLGLGDIVADGDGSSDTHAQCSVSDGSIRDEDLSFTITDGSPQDLDPIAQIPLFYRSGASGDWRRITATNFPVTTTGTGRAAWNEDTGATWQLTEVTDGDHVLTHLFATGDVNHPIIGIIGRNEYSNISTAREGAAVEIGQLDDGGLAGLIPETAPIGTIIFQTDDTYTNTVQSRIRATKSGNDYIDWRIQRPGLSHDNLEDVDEDAHHNRQHGLGDTDDHTSATLAELNALVSDATLDDSGDSRPPSGAASGDLTGTYPGPTIDTDAVGNTKLANMAQSTIKGRASGAGTGDPTDLTSAQATAILDAFTSGLQGVAPASGGGTTNFLRADGTWAAPPGGSGEANTASNQGTTGVGVFDNKNGVDLELRNIAAGSTKIDVALDGPNKEVEIDVNEANLDIGNQGGSLANDAAHGTRGGGTQHSAATAVTAGFMAAADKSKLDGIEAGAEVNDVDSVFGRTGAVAAAASDYDADQVDFTPNGDIVSTDVQAAVVEVRDDTDTKLAAKVTGPSSATDNAVVRYDGATGKLVQDSNVTIDDTGRMGIIVSPSSTNPLRVTGIELPDFGVYVGSTTVYNNYAIGDYTNFNFHSANNDFEITGLSDAVQGKLVIIHNTTDYEMTIRHEDTGSSTNNRFDLPNDQDIVLRQNEAASFTYGVQGGGSRWRIIASAARLSDTAPSNVTKAAASAGSATRAARRDHKHDISTAAPGSTGVGTASAEGSATTVARSDHVHQSNTAPSNVTKAAASIGTSGQPARADHKHDITTAAAVSVGTANAEGSATTLARSDHTHQVTGLTISGQAQGDILYRNASAWVRLAAGTAGQVLKTNGAGANPAWGSVSAFPEKLFQADQLESPNSADWAVNALAPLIPDASNLALSVRAFDDTTVEGIGFTVRVPTGASNIVLWFLSRAASTPGGSVNVGLNLYKRAVPDNSAIPAWGSATALTNLAFTTNTYYQKDTQTISLATLGLTTGVTYLFELCRNVPTDTLSGDWLLHSLVVGWS